MSEIERTARLHVAIMARLLVDTFGIMADSIAAKLHDAGLTLARLEPEPPEGCTCQGCGRKYRVDVMVPDSLWEQIKPAGKPSRAGLLCGSCIGTRIEAIGDFNAFALLPIKPDEATVDEMVAQVCPLISNLVDKAPREECHRCPAIIDTDYGDGVQMCRALAEEIALAAYRAAVSA